MTNSRLAALALIMSSAFATTITLPPTGHAESEHYRFRSPSGDIVCVMQRNHDNNDPAGYGDGTSTCQVDNHTYPIPDRHYVGLDGRPSYCYLIGWGSRLSLAQGREPHLDCVGGDLIFPQPLPTLDYGQSTSLGAITCASEQSAVTCTDTSTGRFFRVSPDFYELG